MKLRCGVVLRVRNPEDFIRYNLLNGTFTKIEISIIDYYHDTDKPMYQITCNPDTSDYINGITSGSLASLKRIISEGIRGYKQKERIKWVKVGDSTSEDK